MKRPKCAVKKCENPGFIYYGSKWICGECMVRILEKERQRKDKQIEELE